MNDFGIFFYLILFLAIGGYAILNWYRKKEIQDLKAVELKILAAENNLTYLEDGSRLTRNLERLDLLAGPRGKAKNILLSKTESHAVQIFNASYDVKQGKSSKTIDVTAILISFEEFQLPRFDLKSTTAFDGFSFFDNMSKVDPIMLPKWANSGYSTFHNKANKPESVATFLANKKEIETLISTPNFHLLAASEHNLILYQNGAMPSTLGGYNHLRQKAQRMVDIFYPYAKNDAGPPNDVQLIKKSLKG